MDYTDRHSATGTRARLNHALFDLLKAWVPASGPPVEAALEDFLDALDAHLEHRMTTEEVT